MFKCVSYSCHVDMLHVVSYCITVTWM